MFFFFIFFSFFKDKNRILKTINTLAPPKECQTINIIVIGHKGSGKSSVINTLHTAIRNSDEISTATTVYGKNNPSTTSKVWIR